MTLEMCLTIPKVFLRPAEHRQTTGANIARFLKVADGMMAQGIV